MRFFYPIALLFAFALAHGASAHSSPTASAASLLLPGQSSQGQSTRPVQAQPTPQYSGEVSFNGFPVPGATVIATRGGKSFSTVTTQNGIYFFPALPEGTWTIKVEMTGFVTARQDIEITSRTPPTKWELKMLPLTAIKAETFHPERARESAEAGASAPSPAKSRSPAESAGQGYPPQPGNGGRTAAGLETNPNESATSSAAATSPQRMMAMPGLLINGSSNNAATSAFALPPAFGNHRYGGNGLYRFALGMILDNSALDAAPFSLVGQSIPKPIYDRVTGTAAFGGPLKLRHLFKNGPTLFADDEWTRYVDDTTATALMPNSAERDGDFSQAVNALGKPIQLVDPTTGSAFPGNVIPQGQLSPQARALLRLYPLPNFNGGARYNYQTQILDDEHQNILQLRLEQNINAHNQLYGGFYDLSTRTATPNLFGFLDTTNVLGIDTDVHWSHQLSQMLYLNLGYEFSRQSTRVKPNFENVENVSGQAGISGNDQSPTDWGPPSLAFSSGLAGLSDADASFNRNQTSSVSYSLFWSRGLHNLTFGGDFRRQEFNVLSQQDPRGTFTFTGTATAGAGGAGSDFADFLLGIPDASSIAFGNADKYFRDSVYDDYVDDDYRVRPSFTLNAGLRWEYGVPINELYGRLVNLDVAGDFTAVAPVLAADPIGPLTGQRYPSSLVRPDVTGFEPRVGIAWRPIAGSSMVVRAGYGIYDNTSVYQTLALQMAQQAPLSKSLSVANSMACPLTLANGFKPCSAVTPDTFAIDPNFQVGYAQTWDLSIQQDLPGSLQLTATYLGTKGTRGLQEFLPNSYPPGAANPCPACPSGFTYFASNGNSTREAAQIELRRRLESGFTATLEYTYAQAIDDDSLLGGQGAAATPQSMSMASFLAQGTAASNGTSQGSATIAEDWRDLEAERSLSSFDQRNLLNLQVQYSTGMGMHGGTLLSGWRGALLKEWTFLTEISVGSGLPETPVYLAPTPGTGVTGSLRPSVTSAPLYQPPAGLFLNPASYALPQPGAWGNAGRDSIIGPAQFSLDASMGRTFRIHGRYNLDLRLDSINALNHVTYSAWNTVFGGTTFGLPVAANPMRSIQTTLRLRF